MDKVDRKDKVDMVELVDEVDKVDNLDIDNVDKDKVDSVFLGEFAGTPPAVDPFQHILIKGSECIVHLNYFSSSSPLPITSFCCFNIPNICNANDISLTEPFVYHITMQQLNRVRQCARKNQGQ